MSKVPDNKIIDSEEDEPLSKSFVRIKFGIMMFRTGKYELCVKHLELAEKNVKKSSDLYFYLGSSLISLKQYHYGIQMLKKCIQIKPSFTSAIINLGAAYLMLNDIDNALYFCKCALEIEPLCREAIMNISNIYRMQGDIDSAYKLIKSSLDREFPNNNFLIKKIDQNELYTSKNLTQKFNSIIVCCVKWGTLYSANYVNKLYKGVERVFRDSNIDFTFRCYTDIDKDLDPNIKVDYLPANLNGWWGKTYLFSKEADFCGSRILYIDLDTVMGEKVDSTILYDFINEKCIFGTLSTRNISCELCLLEGYNSSIILWNDCEELRFLYYNFSVEIKKYIHRFDHWLEYCIQNAYKLNIKYKILDFCNTFNIKKNVGSNFIITNHKNSQLNHNEQNDDQNVEQSDENNEDVDIDLYPPENTICVTFPREPKPHEIINLNYYRGKFVKWMNECW